MKEILRTGKKYIAVFCGLIFLYIVLMVLVHMIPGSAVEENFLEAVTGFETEHSWMLDPFMPGTEMDGVAEYQIFSMTNLIEGKGPLYNSMKLYYARYWHGYLVYVRPLLAAVGYGQLKYINMMLCFVMLCIAYEQVKELCGRKVAMALVVTLCMGNIVAVPLLVQYMSVYYVTEIGIIAYCMLYKKKKLKNIGIFFMIIGSVTNFVDFLTAPLITLGLILVLALLLYEKEPDYNFKKGFWFLIRNSVAWVCGYAFTWIAKWCIASVVLRKNVILEGINQVLLRTQGNSSMPGHPLAAVERNLERMFPGVTVAAFLVLLVIWIVCWFKKQQKVKNVVGHLPLLLLALYPFVWYVVLANHSEIHAHFTYRTLEITIFAVLSFMAVSLNKGKEEN